VIWKNRVIHGTPGQVARDLVIGKSEAKYSREFRMDAN
jgi:hypothetical protein